MRSWISAALSIYLIILLIRVVLEYVRMFSRNWQPRGVILLAVEGVYTVTDPPVKALRKVIPPLRLGPVSLDLSILVLFILINVAIRLVWMF